eukprot:scaffold166794_cov32-Tisochrysis_lutea.AAC.6
MPLMNVYRLSCRSTAKTSAVPSLPRPCEDTMPTVMAAILHSRPWRARRLLAHRPSLMCLLGALVRLVRNVRHMRNVSSCSSRRLLRDAFDLGADAH